jgi:transposase InsO family protein
LRRANETVKLASARSPPGGVRPPPEVPKTFIDQHRDPFRVEPICKVWRISPSGYWRYAAQLRDPSRRCARAKRDEFMWTQIKRVWRANMRVYGADKVWKQMNREGVTAARCTVERLMKQQGLRGVIRGNRVRTTIPEVSALEQARYARRPDNDGTLIHHSDRGSQYVSIGCSKRLAQACIEPSVGSRGDSYDNTLTETIKGLYKAELIHRRAPWNTRGSVERATLE